MRPALTPKPRLGLQLRMIEGRCVGQNSRTTSILAMTSGGIVKGRLFNRTSLEERFGLCWFRELEGHGVASQKRPRAMLARRPMLAGRVAFTSSDHPEARVKPLSRKFCVWRGDVKGLGATDGCIACTTLSWATEVL